jgi:hypothetical protein
VAQSPHAAIVTMPSRIADRARPAGRGYITQDISILRSFGTASAYLAVLVLALYLNTPEMKALYLHPQALWATFALTLF